MRKLLNTLYITNEKAYLYLKGETLVCKVEKDTLLQIPFDNFESIVCFSYIGMSPALMGKCVNSNVPIAFISPSGKFLAKVTGETKGNVFLRVQQIDCFRKCNEDLAKNTLAAKFSNTIKLIKRSQHDNEVLRTNDEINKTVDVLKESIVQIYQVRDIPSMMGIEGIAQKNISLFLVN
nr:CRISPR-associated endonuclease Cas1 [Aminicella lysinilytica]